MNEKNGRFRLRSALFPAGYYASNSIYQGYISLYYTSLGFHSGQLGAISAAASLAALTAQPLWGMLGDRNRNRKRLLCLLSFAAAAMLPLALMNGGFWMQVTAAFAFYAFFCALLPLSDTILLEAEGGRFGAYRLVGGAGFALSGAIFGMLRDRLGRGGAIWGAAALLGLTALSALLLPDGSARKDREKASILTLLKEKRLVILLLFVLPLQMSMGYFYTFYAPHFKALGGSDALLGLGYLISAASEAPYLLLSGRIYRRWGAVKPMCVAAAMLAARWALLGISSNAWIALASQLLHGGGFIVITVSMAYWISENVPENLRASGQGLLNMVTFGVARITGNLLGGLLARMAGMDTAFLVGALLCAAAAVFGALALRRAN